MKQDSVAMAMEAGARGELLTSWPVVQAARSNDVTYVVGIYAAATVLSLILSLVVHNVYVAIVFDLLLYAMWAGIAYVFVACGTKFSHQMATWGIALVGGIIACQKVMSSFVAAAFTNTTNALLVDTGISVPGAGTYIFQMLLFAVIAAGCIYFVVKMFRAMQTISTIPPVVDPPVTQI